MSQPDFGSSIYIHSTSKCGQVNWNVLLIGLTSAVGATNPSRGVLDFNDWRALQPIFDAAKLAGIFVTLRPGEPPSIAPLRYI